MHSQRKSQELLAYARRQKTLAKNAYIHTSTHIEAPKVSRDHSTENKTKFSLRCKSRIASVLSELNHPPVPHKLRRVLLVELLTQLIV